MNEGDAKEVQQHDVEMENQPSTPTGNNGFHSVEEMVEFLKGEHLWDANPIQNCMLRFLDDVRLGSAQGVVPNCCAKISSLFSEFAEKTSDQNRWETADRHSTMSNDYSS